MPPSGSTRRERSPAPIAAAVSSMRRSGRRLAVINHSPNSSALAITAIVTSTSIHLSWLSVVSVSCSGTPRISVESEEGTDWARRRKREPPWTALTVARLGLPSAAGPKPFGMRGAGALSPGRVSVPWITGEPSPGRISTYVPGVSTPNWARKLIRRSGPPGPGPGPCLSNWSSDPATPFALESSELSTRLKSDERRAA